MTFRFERGEEDSLGLPRNLGNGLILRWSRPEDSERIAECLGNIFAEDGEPDEAVMYGIRDWTSERHLSVGPNGFTLITDENKGSQIVSTLTLNSQIWAYEGISFGVGQVEAVGTDPDYRRKG